jgi:hypothetical protein
MWTLAFAACGFSPQPLNGDSKTSIDARTDAPDAPPGTICYGTSPVDMVCYDTANGKKPSTSQRNYNGQLTISTESMTTCDQNAILPPGAPCVISGSTISFTSSAQIRATGAHALIFLATDAAGIDINGGALIDATTSASTINMPPAGTQTACDGSVAATGRGGGFGGTFVALGGAGADSSGTGHGVPASAQTADSLRGGCPGGLGANGPLIGPNSPSGGIGGGAFAFNALTIAVGGLIAAAGGQGNSTNAQDSGGGGGGAGGMVVLDSPNISGGGEIDVKGGGGGEGTGGNQGSDGHAGYETGNRTDESKGGVGGTTGGNGGSGSSTGAGAPGAVATNTNEGGGGGGGANGVIVTTSTPTSQITGVDP